MQQYHNRSNIVIIVITIILLCISYSWVIAPLQAQKHNLHEQQASINQQTNNIKQQIQKLQPWQKQWQVLAKNFSKQKAPNEPPQLSTPAILKNISNLINSSQLTVISIQPQIINNKNNPDSLTPQTFAISGSGSYQQIVNFFLTARNLNLLTNISIFTIKPLGNENSLIFNVFLEVFDFAHKKHSEKINISGDPFINTLTTASLPLTTWDSKDLRFLGTIQQDNQIWGILYDPSEQLHYVTVGTLIGTNRNKINKITSSIITTENNQDNIYR